MKRWIKACAVLAFLLFVSALAVPKLLSSDYAKTRIAAQLSEITGRAVSLNGNSAVSLYPYLGVSYNDVIISGDENEEPLVVVEQLRAQLGLLSTLWGQAKLTELQFIRPHFTLILQADGSHNWAVTKGPLAERLSLKQGQEPQALSFGSLFIEDGIFTIKNNQKDETQQLTSVDGQVVWPDISAQGSLNFTAVLGGEVITVEASATSPFMMLRQEVSPITVNLESAPLNLSFEGAFDPLQNNVKGTLQANTQSVRRLAEWTNRPLKAADSLNDLAIEGEIEGRLDKLEINNANVQVGEHLATGLLQLETRSENMLSIAGTLAFDSIDFHCVDFVDKIKNEQEVEDLPFPLSNLDGVFLDLRLSAQQAQCGPLEFANFAASAVINDQEASFDVGHAEAFNGILSGALKVKRVEETTTLVTDVVLSDIDLQDLSAFYDHGEDTLALEGKGDAQFTLQFSGNKLSHLITKLYGHGQITSKNGVLLGVDLTQVRPSLEANNDEPILSFSGQTDYQHLKLDFYLANGTAIFHDSTLHNETLRVDVAGQANLRKNTLALNGKISPFEKEKIEDIEPETPAQDVTQEGVVKGEDNQVAESLREEGEKSQSAKDEDQQVKEKTPPLFFFIGGTAKTPHVVPLNIIPKSYSP